MPVQVVPENIFKYLKRGVDMEKFGPPPKVTKGQGQQGGGEGAYPDLRDSVRPNVTMPTSVEAILKGSELTFLGPSEIFAEVAPVPPEGSSNVHPKVAPVTAAPSVKSGVPSPQYSKEYKDFLKGGESLPSRRHSGWPKFVGLRGGMPRTRKLFLNDEEISDLVDSPKKSAASHPTSSSSDLAGPANPSSSDPTPSTSRSVAVEDSEDGSSPPKKILCTPVKLSNKPETPTTPRTPDDFIVKECGGYTVKMQKGPCTPIRIPDRDKPVPEIQFHTPSRTPVTPVNDDQTAGPDHEFFDGSQPNCLYVGHPGQGTTGQPWDKSQIRNYYFCVTTRGDAMVLTLRASKDISIAELSVGLLSYYARKQIVLEDPLLWLAGKEVSHEEKLFNFPKNSLFLISEGVRGLKTEHRSHRGFLWECFACHQGWNFPGKVTKVCTATARNHQIYFSAQLKKSTGAVLDRSNNPWGLPPGHNKAANIKTSQQVGSSVDSGPLLQSQEPEPQPGPSKAKSDKIVELQSMPANPRMKRVERVMRSLILADKAVRKSTAPPIAPQLGRNAKSKASKKLKLVSQPGSSSEDDISGTDSGSDPEFKVGPELPDTSDSDDGLHAESSEDNEVAQDENDNRASRKGPVIPLTDDESEDEENVRRARRAIKHHMEEVIEKILAGPAVPRENVFVTDEEDEEWVKKYLHAPIMKNSAIVQKYGSRAPEQVMRMIMAGERPGPKSTIPRGLFTQTSVLYVSALKELLGLYQQQLIDAGMQDRLIDGKLKFRQFFLFKQEKFVEIPQDIEGLLDMMVGANKKAHALSGFKYMIKGLLKFASKPEGHKLFMTRLPHQEELNEMTFRDIADRERQSFMSALRDYQTNMESDKLFGHFSGERKLQAEERKEFKETFEGMKLPDPVDTVNKYLADKETKELFEEMEQLAVNKVILSKKRMSQLSRFYLKRLLVKMGVRIECFGDTFTRGLFFVSLKQPPASYPYVAVNGQDGLNQQDRNVAENIVTYADSGTRYYTRKNPHVADPNDPNDPRTQDDWDLTQGVVVKIALHKTGAKYPMYLWFSQVEIIRLRMYEEISANFLIANGLRLDDNGVPDNSCPMFITGDGTALVHTHMHPLDFSDFALIANVPSITSKNFRTMFSNLLLGQKNFVLRECEEWVMAHGPNTAKKFYCEETNKKMMACYGNDWYQQQLTKSVSDTGAGGEGSSSRATVMSRGQAEREVAGYVAESEEQLKKMLAVEDKRDAATPLSLERVMNNRTRNAFVQLIVDNGPQMMDLMMSRRAVKNKKCYKAALRMLCMTDPDDPNVQLLKETLLEFAELMKEEDITTPRNLMWSYAVKMVNQLHLLKFVSTLDNTRLKVIMGKVIKEHGYKFTFGNVALAKSLTFWVSRETAREQSLIVPDELHTMEEEIRGREERRLRAELNKETEDDVVNEEEKEDDVEEVEREDDDEERSVKFTTFDDREMECDMGGMKFTLPPGTPCKMTPKKFGRITWTDKMKLQLLELYMEKAADPLKRPKPSEGVRSRAVYRRDAGVQDLYENSTITLDSGRIVKISSICKVDHILNTLATGQLTGQTSLGLVKLIDEVMEGEERTSEKLQVKKPEILKLALSLINEDTESE